MAHHPPRLSLHSIQDGVELSSTVLQTNVDDNHIIGVWWLKDAPVAERPGPADPFERKGNIVRRPRLQYWLIDNL